jgi:hypothetical protein
LPKEWEETPPPPVILTSVGIRGLKARALTICKSFARPTLKVSFARAKASSPTPEKFKQSVSKNSVENGRPQRPIDKRGDGLSVRTALLEALLTL